MSNSCFKAYDIRGTYPEPLSRSFAVSLGKAFSTYLNAKTVVVGRDVRLSSPALAQGLIDGLISCGVEVLDLGVCGTEEVYFATCHYEADGGVMITGSHNPLEYNGFKLVREQAIPLNGDCGLGEIEALMLADDFQTALKRGNVTARGDKSAYINCLLSFVSNVEFRPLKIVVNAGNGPAGAVIDLLEPHLPFEFIKLQHEPDGHFPAGVPNPMLPENRALTAQAVIDHNADLAISWDGDFDRCFFYDHRGAFVESYYMVGLLAKILLQKSPGENVLYDPRLVWNTIEQVSSAGGTSLQCKAGHAFMKMRMREEDAVYGGEMSAHHYFRDFFYCDSGMVPWLLVLVELSERNCTLKSLIDEAMASYPCSGEINFRVKNCAEVLAAVVELFSDDALAMDEMDGVSFSFEQWRFNLRASNTEPLLRLNVEARLRNPLVASGGVRPSFPSNYVQKRTRSSGKKNLPSQKLVGIPENEIDGRALVEEKVALLSKIILPYVVAI